MIDNMTVWCGDRSMIGHLTSKFFKNKKGLFENFNNEYTFKLYNPENLSNSNNYIRVCSVKFGCFLLLQGSLRKWYLAKSPIGDTLDDFVQQEYDEALKLLFSLLKIPDEKREFFYISRMEIGATVLTMETCNEIIKRIVGYKSACYKPTLFYSGCKKYSSKGMSLTLYDKVNEISTNCKKYIKNQFLSEYKTENYFRIELVLKGGKSGIMKRLKINTLEESVDWFPLFYFYFWDEIQNIRVSDIYAKQPILEKDAGQKEIMNYLKLCGMYALGENEMNQIINSSKDAKNIRQAIKRIHKNTPVRYSSYNKQSLLKDTRRQIICLMKRNDCLHLAKGLVIEKSDI